MVKKDDHINHLHRQQKHFYQYVFSFYGIQGRDTLVVFMNLSRLMSAKIDEPILHVQGWINSQIKITVARL